MWRKTGLMGCILGLALVAGTARGGLEINTFDGWLGDESLPGFGYDYPATPSNRAETFGQTFLVTSPNTILTSFSFWVDDNTGLPITFGAYVYEWDGTKATGSALYANAPNATTNSSSWDAFTFSPNITLEAGQNYIAFMSTSAAGGTAPSEGAVGIRTGDLYTEGSAFFLDSGSDTSAWTSLAWSATSDGTDAVFRLEFDEPAPPAVPEPSTIMLFCLGGACAALARRRRFATSSQL